MPCRLEGDTERTALESDAGNYRELLEKAWTEIAFLFKNE
jgi:hypothetical protein